MSRIYLQEAFRAMESFEDTNDFSLNDAGIKDILDFKDHDELSDIVDVVDPEAETEEDVKDTYIGNVILQCEVCKSPIFKAIEDVEIEEDEELANLDEECPICHSTDGFKVIGVVAPYEEDSEIKVEVEDKDKKEDDYETEYEDEDGEVENGEDDEEDDDEKNECYNRVSEDYDDANSSLDAPFQDDSKKIAYIRRHAKEVLYGDDDDNEYFSHDIKMTPGEKPGPFHKRVREEAKRRFEELVKTLAADESLTTKRKVDTKVSNLYVEYLDTFDESLEVGHANGIKEGFEKIALETDDKIIRVSEEEKPETGDEMIAPVPDSVKSALLPSDATNEIIGEDDFSMEPIPENPDFGEESIEIPDEDEPVYDENTQEEDEDGYKESLKSSNKNRINESYVDFEVDDFNENSFNKLCESYLKSVYDNVKGFSMSNIWQDGGNTQQVVIEGLINFTSGNKKPTKFIFEAKDATKSGKVNFIGENTNITRGKKAFTLSGRLTEGKFLAESLKYNYKVNSNRVSGTVRV